MLEYVLGFYGILNDKVTIVMLESIQHAKQEHSEAAHFPEFTCAYQEEENNSTIP
jgi:hypothetical protein